MVAALLMVPCFSKAFAGALEDYVQKSDASFNWKFTEHTGKKDSKTAHLEVVSQTWRGQFWSHHLYIYRPEKVQKSADRIFVHYG